MDIEMIETPVDLAHVKSQLITQRVTAAIAERAVSFLPETAVGVALYGSFARGDHGANSDVDLIVIAARRIQPPADENFSINSYSTGELLDAAGTLFAYHLRRDGIALHGADAVEKLLARAEPPDATALLERIRRLAAVVNVSPANAHAHVSGLIRVAKYLLRSAMYAQSIRAGRPSFSVSELASRAAEPELVALLSSHASVAPAPTYRVLEELRARLERLLGTIPNPPNGTLEAIAVVAWEEDRDLARLAILSMGSEQDVPYDLLGRVLL